jgi:thiol-disulfide isomerase/thioredoxin
MSASVCLAALMLLGQSTTGAVGDDKVNQLSDDIKQTMTLFESLKTGLKTEQEAKTLVSNLGEKLTIIAQAAEKAQAQAKSDDIKAKLAMVRFEALANGVQTPTQLEVLAGEIATKYKESAGLCPSIEKLTFSQFIGQDKYGVVDAILKQSKNPEVVASAYLANYFSQMMSDSPDINKYKTLSDTYPKTKAGQRAGRIYTYRTKLGLSSPMPDLDLELITGFKFKVSSLLGRVVVLDFWGMWQPACVAEIPEIKKYNALYPSKIAWIGVNTDGCTKGYLTQQLSSMGANWQTVYGGSPTGQLPMDLGIIAYPSKIIIDSFGIVRYVPSIRDWRPVLDEALSKA